MKLGVQLYSVKNSMLKDPISTIKSVVENGYTNIEAANHNAEKDYGVGFNVSAKEIGNILNDLGAKMISTHISPITDTNLEKILEYYTELGTKNIVMPMDFYKNKDEVLKKAENLNLIGEKCKSYNMNLLYHNHFHEYQIFNGESIMDIILNNTDPSLVKLELDTYWAMRGGQNVPELLKKYGKRVTLLHQKDYPKNKDNHINLIDKVNLENICVDMDYFSSVVHSDSFIEIGEGIMDIQEIINTASEYCDVDYIILEQDASTHNEIDSIKISINNLSKFNGIDM